MGKERVRWCFSVMSGLFFIWTSRATWTSAHTSQIMSHYNSHSHPCLYRAQAATRRERLSQLVSLEQVQDFGINGSALYFTARRDLGGGGNAHARKKVWRNEKDLCSVSISMLRKSYQMSFFIRPIITRNHTLFVILYPADKITH